MTEPAVPDFNEIWRRVIECEGDEFIQVRGKRFSYVCQGNTLSLSSTNQLVARSQFEQAFERVPLMSPAIIQDLRAPSYIFAIMMDDRIRQHDW